MIHPYAAELIAKADLMGQSDQWCVVSYDPQTKVYSVCGTWDREHVLIEAGKLREQYDTPGADLEDMQVHVAQFLQGDS